MDLDAETFLTRFETRDLGPEFFDHPGHIYMAWVHLRRYGLEEANRRMCDGIRDLAAKFDAPEKYSHTLTEALMRIISLRMARAGKQDFETFLKTNPDLVEDAQGVLARYYSASHLNSAEARSSWVEPDLSPIV